MHIAQCAGGVDKYLQMLLANMDRNAFKHILVCSHDYSAEDYKGIVDEFIQIDMCNALSLSKDGKAIAEVRKLIKSLSPDIIYCHSSKAGGIGRIANLGIGVPLVYNAHGWAFSMKGSKVKRFIYLVIERLLARLTTQIVTISNDEKQIAVQYHVAKPERIKTIFNGIDMEAVKAQLASGNISRQSLGIPDDAYLVGMVGRISRQKAPDTFIRMAARVREVIPQAWFMIVGDGDERAECEQLVADNGLHDCFHITGWVNNPLVYANLFDQAVLLSRWEGFGLVLAEYMTLGKPIVATEVNAIPDLIVDRENGLLVNVDDAEKAAAAVIEIYHDKTLRNNMVENGKIRASVLFDVKRTAREHERLFVKICESGGVILSIQLFKVVVQPSFLKERRASA